MIISDVWSCVYLYLDLDSTAILLSLSVPLFVFLSHSHSHHLRWSVCFSASLWDSLCDHLCVQYTTYAERRVVCTHKVWKMWTSWFRGTAILGQLGYAGLHSGGEHSWASPWGQFGSRSDSWLAYSQSFTQFMYASRTSMLIECAVWCIGYNV